MFQVTIEAESVEQFREKISALANFFSVSGLAGSNPVSPTNLVSENIDKTSNVSDLSKRNKPGRKPKQQVDEKPEPVTLTQPTPVSAGPTGSPTHTREEAMEALKQLNVLKGLPVARDLLAQFGCARMSDLKESDYGAFVDACKAKAAE